jgi:hypothetical protein
MPGPGGFSWAVRSYSFRALRDDDPEVMSAAFTALGWDKPALQYENYLAEQRAGVRDVLVATVDDEFAEYVTGR